MEAGFVFTYYIHDTVIKRKILSQGLYIRENTLGYTNDFIDEPDFHVYI